MSFAGIAFSRTNLCPVKQTDLFCKYGLVRSGMSRAPRWAVQPPGTGDRFYCGQCRASVTACIVVSVERYAAGIAASVRVFFFFFLFSPTPI